MLFCTMLFLVYTFLRSIKIVLVINVHDLTESYSALDLHFLGIFVNKLLDSSVVPLAMQLIIQQNFLATYERLVASSESGMKFTESPQNVAMMLAGGVATTILNWLKNRQSLSKDDFIKELSGMIRRILEP